MRKKVNKYIRREIQGEGDCQRRNEGMGKEDRKEGRKDKMEGGEKQRWNKAAEEGKRAWGKGT